MNCKKCGAELEQDAKFCMACGTAVEESVKANEQVEVAKEAVTKQVEKIKKKKFNLYFIVGTIFIIIGLVNVFTAGSSVSSASFGADFYTYTYRGIVAIAESLASIQGVLGWILVALGVNINLNAKNR